MHLTTRFLCFFEPRTRLTPSTIIHPSAASPIVRSMPTATACYSAVDLNGSRFRLQACESDLNKSKGRIFGRQTLANTVWVANRVQFSRRRENCRGPVIAKS